VQAGLHQQKRHPDAPDDADGFDAGYEVQDLRAENESCEEITEEVYAGVPFL
jgi:hypothetical protein